MIFLKRPVFTLVFLILLLNKRAFLFIPVVNPEIGWSLQKELFDKFDKEYLKEQLSQIDDKNPVISAFIRKFSETTDDQLGAAWCGLVVFKLLQSQAEANRMKMEINLG